MRRPMSWVMAVLSLTQTAMAEERVIQHAYGQTEVTGMPTRVVSLSYIGHDFLLALGTKPVALRYWYGPHPFGVWPWAQEVLGDAEPLVLYGGINIEQIALLQPDLIVGQWSGMTQGEYDLLSVIAPTLPHPKGEREYSASWQLMTAQLGRALGREEEAEQLVTDTLAKFDRLAARHPDWKGQSAVAVQPSRFSAYGSQDLRGRFLTDLGFDLPEAVDELGGFDPNFISVPQEVADVLDTDLLVWVDAPDINAALDAVALRSTLRAKQEGREIYADFNLSAAINFSSPLSLPYALERIEPLIEAALDGDPNTAVPGWTSDGKVVQE